MLTLLGKLAWHIFMLFVTLWLTYELLRSANAFDHTHGMFEFQSVVIYILLLIYIKMD